MKHFFSIFAVAAAVVAACAVSSCKKTESVSPIVGEWVNETMVDGTSGQVPRTVTYTFYENGSVNMYVYYSGQMSGGNGGTYTYNAPDVAITFSEPTTNETGTLNGDKLTIASQYYGVGTIELTKNQ